MPWKLSLVLFSLGFILACGSNDGPSGGDTVHLVDASPAIDWVLDTRPVAHRTTRPPRFPVNCRTSRHRCPKRVTRRRTPPHRMKR